MDDAGRGARGLQPRLTSRLAAAVAEVWGVRLANAQVLGGSTGLNLRADSDSGPVVVRVHRRHVSEARVEALQLAREAAGVAGVPIALPVLGRHGQRHTTADSCVVDVEQFVESDGTMDTFARIASAMPWLGRLHDGLAEAELPSDADDLQFANFLAERDIVTKVTAGAARVRSIAPWHGAVAHASEALAARLVEASSAGPAIDSQWCHGDFWDNNVLFRGEQVALVTDFGFMSQRPRIDDLALTLYFTLWGLQAADQPDDRARLAQLVDAYDSGTERVLSGIERRALPLAIARQPLWSIGVWAAELDEGAAVDAHLLGHDVALRLGTSILDDLERWRSAFRAP
jgi:Ser/Thr protein kinase RdoA (MazF antagonist)